jgi:hypothetical protein
MVREPSGRQACRFSSSAPGSSNNVRTVNDLHLFLTAKLGISIPVQPDHRFVAPADDQQGRRLDSGERRSGQIRSPAARHHDDNLFCQLGGGNQGGRCSGAGAEVTDGQAPQLCLSFAPAGGQAG